MNKNVGKTLVSLMLLILFASFADAGVTEETTPWPVGTTPAQYDLKAYQTPVKNQNGRGSCTCFSFMGALEAAYIREYGMNLTNYLTQDGRDKLQKYNIYNADVCSKICYLPDCFSTCMENAFDLSEEYCQFILVSVQHSYNTVSGIENQIAFWNQTEYPRDPTIDPVKNLGFDLGVTQGATVPLERYAPYFGVANANAGHGDQAICQIAADSDIVLKDQKGSPIPIPNGYPCIPEQTRTQKNIDDFNYDPRYIPPDAKKNATFGAKSIRRLGIPEFKNTNILESIIYSNHEVVVGLNAYGIDCGSGNPSRYIDGTLTQFYSDGNPICAFPTNNKLGGHNMVLIGYDRTKQLLLLKNSWGPGDLPYWWVPYGIAQQFQDAFVILDVRDPELGPMIEPMWLGKWKMDIDGNRGDLIIRRTREQDNALWNMDANKSYLVTDSGLGTYARLGTFYDSLGTPHKVTGRVSNIIDQIELNIDFANQESPPDQPPPNNTAETPTGQAFRLAMFYTPNTPTHGNYASGYTTVNDVKYGVVLYAPSVGLFHASGTFNISNWLDSYTLYYNNAPDPVSFRVTNIGTPGLYYPADIEWNGVAAQAGIGRPDENHLFFFNTLMPGLYYHASEMGILSGLGVIGVSDSFKPQLTLTGTSPGQYGWIVSPVTLTLNGADQGGTGLEYSLDGLNWMDYTGPLTLTDGVTTVSYRYKSGILGMTQQQTFKIDTMPPVITANRMQGPNANGWNNGDVTVRFSCSDNGSGLASGSPPADVVVSSEGNNQSVTGTCKDMAGNTASITVSGINIDKTPPAMTCSVNPGELWPPNHNLVPVNVSVQVSDLLSGPDGFTLVSVISNEPDNGLGDGDTSGDIQGFEAGTPDTNGQLRAERSGAGSGRVYTLNYTGMDLAGNVAACSATVTTPHDKDK